MPSRGRTLVAYAAKDGTTAADGIGRNSPYTRALLAALEEPGLEVNFLLRRVRDQVVEATGGRQEPYVYGTLGSEPVYLVPSTPAAEGGATGAAYQEAKQIGMLEAWDAFLQYCDGSVYCGLARAARYRLAAGAVTEVTAGSSAPAIEPDQQVAMVDPVAPGASARPDDPLPSLGPAALFIRGVNSQFGLYGESVDHAAARSSYEEAAARGDALAIIGLGSLHYSGSGIAKDAAEALRLFQQAAELGRAEAMNNVGVMYETGAGTARNQSKAREWYRARGGRRQPDGDAQSRTDACHRKGRPARPRPRRSAGGRRR